MIIIFSFSTFNSTKEEDEVTASILVNFVDDNRSPAEADHAKTRRGICQSSTLALKRRAKRSSLLVSSSSAQRGSHLLPLSLSSSEIGKMMININANNIKINVNASTSTPTSNTGNIEAAPSRPAAYYDTRPLADCLILGGTRHLLR